MTETLQFGSALYPSLAQCRVILIGLTGKDFEVSMKLSPEIEAVLPQAVELIQREVSRLINQSVKDT